MALEELFQDVGVPTHMHTDGAKALTTGQWRKVCQSYGPVKQMVSEPLNPWQKRAKAEIRELKKQVLRIMSHKGIPRRFWDYVAEYVSEIQSRTAHPLYNLKACVVLGPWGLSGGKEIAWPVVGSCSSSWTGFCWIVPQLGRVIARSMVQPVSEEERGLDSFKTRLKDLDKSVQDFLNRGDTHVPDGGVGWKANCVTGVHHAGS
ncbi:predicted protein [Phaeodactylum tricornutum CCAP 1055/1]|uniref:Uncharacterized protein n=2 Tax=Phaeodactylum tricornutum TaxID=2850 RepID=B7G8F8_PHATC|nr:predicted protein [Phaeodactylum tricornutum CCAP 1055/1]EEC45038.1 predicted protein [Phaeodactylum tricornutum CCAP 1055/1]|eukprot:XP_002183338.1 predicted protein [Phaeodactylum tricornutum CCAP 1055/1]